MEAAARCLEGFPYGSIPTQHLYMRAGREEEDRNNRNKWMEVAVGTPDHGHMDMEPLDTLPSSGFPGHLLQCPEQMQLSGSRNSARLLAQTPPGLAPNPILPPSAPPGPGGLSK